MAKHRKPTAASKTAKLTRTAVTGGAAAAAIAAVTVSGAQAAGAATLPATLPVTFAHDDASGTAGFDATGNIALNLGTGTSAEVDVDLAKLGLTTAPKTAPSFTTDKYAAGSPRWVIELANGNFITGYPEQEGGGAKADFTGTQWALGTGTHVTYQEALTEANDPLGNVAVTDAGIVEDADQAPSTLDTLTGVQYDGLTAAPAPAAPPTAVTVKLSAGHVVAGTLSNNRAEVAWTATPAAASYRVELVGPNFPGGRFNTVHVTSAFYSGLAAGHSYTVFITPLNANGSVAGPTGHITFITKH